MERWTVLYDDDCGFCRWSVDRILRLDRYDRLAAAPIRGWQGRRLLTSLPLAERLSSWHLRSPSGEVLSGGPAVAPLLRLLPGGRPVAMVAERFPGMTEHLYALVARHRTRVGRLLGKEACQVDPARPAAIGPPPR